MIKVIGSILFKDVLIGRKMTEGTGTRMSKELKVQSPITLGETKWHKSHTEE